MKDMSVEELIDIIATVITPVSEVHEARAELLRRFEALEKELESWRGSRDGVLQHIDEMAYEIESLRCCGNCRVPITGCITKITKSDYYCSKWQSDGLTRKERQA